MKNEAFQPSAVRRESNQDSSPMTPPVTRVIPAARTCRASTASCADESVGSPYPLRIRFPAPSCRTSVSMRKSGPSAVSAAYVTVNFSFEAGSSGSVSFRA